MASEKDSIQTQKLNKIYRLFIQKQDIDGNPLNEGIIITNPISIKFNINRSIYSGIAEMNIDIYNLSPSTRNQLFKDFYFDIEKQKPLFIALSAGYATTELSTIFVGDVWSSYTVREGCNVITRIQAKTGLRNLAQTVELTLEAGMTVEDVVAACMKELPNLDSNYQVAEDYVFHEPVSLMGKPLAIIKKYNSNKNVFVDLNNVYILGQEEAIPGWIPLINDASGLLNAPERRTGTLVFNMMFEPRLQLAQIIQLDSHLAPQFNGQYKIFGIKHQGIISDTSNSRATTTVEVNIGAEIYGKFKQI